MNDVEKKIYQQNYFDRVTKPKRQAAAEAKRKQKAAQREAEELEQARAASLRAIEEAQEHSTTQALSLAKLRKIERQQRAACIAGEFPDPAPDEVLEDSTSYYSHLFKLVEEYIRDTKIALGGNYDFGALYNALSVEPAGQSLLRYAGIEPLAGACWENYAYVNREDGRGVVKTLVHSPENIEEIKAQWDERWTKPQGEMA